MERDVAWKKYDEADLEALEHLAAEYIDFISDNKTERECAASAVALAEEHGYLPLDQAVREGRALKAGDKVWAQAHGKALILAHLGQRPLEQGLNILGAHIDSPRLDLKQNPLYESNGFTLFDTHYYGGIKNYQWVTLPLALHGVIAKKDGTVVDVKVGDDPDDPVFCVTDLLIHLAGKQMAKKANEVVEGEDLDILMGNRPLTCGSGSLDGTQSLGSPGSHGQSTGLSGSCGTRLVGTAEAPGESAASVATSEDVQAPADGEKEEEKEPVKAFALKLLAEKYGIEEEDFLSAEIEVVPAGRARDLGFDRSMVIGYGQDDRVCAYTSLVAQLALAETPEKTAVCVLVDKEEIGSVGATGMASQFFENAMAEIMVYLRRQAELPHPTDLVIGNYVYEKVHEGARTVMHYRNVFPEGREFGWADVGHFGQSQYLLMHSVIYRTDLLRDIDLKLPEHCFYVDNIFVYVPLPHVKTIYYRDVDMYRYFIGREDQSVNENVMMGRIDQQLRVTREMIDAVRLPDDVPEKRLERYMENYLSMMMCICSIFLRMIDTDEAEDKREAIWEYLKAHNPDAYRPIRRSTLNMGTNLPTSFGRRIGITGYRMAQKIFKFN